MNVIFGGLRREDRVNKKRGEEKDISNKSRRKGCWATLGERGIGENLNSVNLKGSASE